MAQITLAELNARNATIARGAGERFQLWDASDAQSNAVKIAWDSVSLNFREYPVGTWDGDELLLTMFGAVSVLSFVVGHSSNTMPPATKATVQTILTQLLRAT